MSDNDGEMYRKLASNITAEITAKAENNLPLLEKRLEQAKIGVNEPTEENEKKTPKITIESHKSSDSVDQGFCTASEPNTPVSTSTIEKLSNKKDNSTTSSSSVIQTTKDSQPVISETPSKLPLEQKNSEDNDPITIKMHAQVSRLVGHQRTLLQDSYRNILQKSVVRHGCSIMLKLFSEYPQYKNIWPQFSQIPDSSLMNTDQLKKHTRVYMNGLKFIINSMDDDKKLSAALKKIATAHIKWNIHKSHIMHMLPALLEVIKENGRIDKEIQEAWTTLFDVIANLVDIFLAVKRGTKL